MDPSEQLDAGRDPGKLGARAMFVTAALVPWFGLFVTIVDMFEHFSDMGVGFVVLLFTVPISFFLTIAGLVRLYLCYSNEESPVFWWPATALAAGPFNLVVFEIVSGFDVVHFVNHWKMS